MAFNVKVQGGLDDGNIFRVDGQCIIGRAPRCQVLLSDPDVAWEHASLQDLAGRLFLQNLSAAGTRLKGHAVSAEARVMHGDEIEITPNCKLVVEERIGKNKDQSLSPPVLAGLIIVLIAVLFGGYKFFQPKPQYIPPVQLSHWVTAYNRLTVRMEEWTERGEFPAEALVLFRDAWRYEMAFNDAGAAQRWDDLRSVLLSIQAPGTGLERRSIAEQASPTQRALNVIMGWDQETNMSIDPQWRTDEAFADALTWFVRKRGMFTNNKVKAAGR